MKYVESIRVTACFAPSDAVWNPSSVTVCPATCVLVPKAPPVGEDDGDGDGEGDADGEGDGEGDADEPVEDPDASLA